jgi:prefoldin subunit 5
MVRGARGKSKKIRRITMNRNAISSDDPQAIEKLRAKLAELEGLQATIKAANAAIRKEKHPERQIAALVALGHPEERARKLLEPDFAGRIGFADYHLTGNSAEIRRIKGRIAQLEQAAQRETTEEVTDKYTYREDTDENRVMFRFDGKPNEATRTLLKSRGFKWSPTRDAWVRLLNDKAIWAAQGIKAFLAAQA